MNYFANFQTPLQQETNVPSYLIYECEMHPKRRFSSFASVCVSSPTSVCASANPDEFEQVQTCKSLKNQRHRKQAAVISETPSWLSESARRSQTSQCSRTPDEGTTAQICKNIRNMSTESHIRRKMTTVTGFCLRLRTLYRKMWVPRWPTCWGRSSGPLCTGPALSSCSGFSPHPRVTPPGWCRILPRKLPWSDTACCLLEKSTGPVKKAHREGMGWCDVLVLACHQVVLQDQLFDDVVRHQLGAVHYGITGDVWQAAWNTGWNGEHTHL